jgi:hypothetical protein
MAANTFHHSVYFWLNEASLEEGARKTIESCQTNLAEIPGIVKMTLGVPAGTSGGPVDNTYGVVLLIEFEDKAAHDAYDVHPSHQRMIAECGHLWSRVQVYDAVSA